MSARLPFDDRRSVPTVAIIGNDAVLMAAPATPVQVAHACLRRGFSVAVPASWGDELVAAEAMRRLASHGRGPAVMCVCPFVRSRLLAPGPDLAPFLVSLVAPPVATARYLRTVYGDHGVHITYIGGCPAADDPSIDARLTPDAFLADLADNGIALAEQPLVFDSIVPPDRRRWCSLPGGSPTAEVLWSEADARTLIEIERDDASTELAQHIIGHEHVLLDLAPALGCVCSGAISSVPARSARVAVASVEPPRALGPVVDSTVVVSLDAPVSPRTPQPATHLAATRHGLELMERRLDELLGTQATTAGGPEGDIEPGVAPLAAAPDTSATGRAPSDYASPSTEETHPLEPQAEAQPRPEQNDPTEDGGVSDPAGVTTHAESLPSAADGLAESLEPSTPPDDVPHEQSTVRRRTPVPAHARYASASIPKTTASGGRALPRAYVAKRRTPPSGMLTVDPVAESATPSGTSPDARRETAGSLLTGEAGQSAREQGGLTAERSDTGDVSARSPATLAVATGESASPAVPAVPHTTASNGVTRETAPQSEPRHRGAAAAAAPNPSTFVILLLALIALAIFVLRALG
jgi:hypothetical protein